jgi:hypothetical protein
LHPLRADFDKQLDRVGGVAFDDILAYPVPRLAVPRYLPQGRWRACVAEERLTVDELPFLAVRVREVFRHGRLRTASEVRAKLGLVAETAIVLLFHGDDGLLEDVVDQAAAAARGGYALVAPPSFSLWEPGRRPNNLLSLRRSFLFYQELGEAGATACPRVGWVEPVDIERLARWVNARSVSLVSLDLMTYSDPAFVRAIEGLAYFDRSTEARVHYLIDGVASVKRMAQVYFAIAPNRVTFTSATMAPPAAKLGGARSLRQRSLEFTNFSRRAQAIAAEVDANSVEEFLSRACCATIDFLERRAEFAA